MTGESAKIAAEATRAVLDLSISAPPGFSVSLKIDNTILAGVIGVGALSLGAFYVANKFRVENALRNALENRNEAGVVDPEVRNIEESSVLVQLYCHSERSFLQFMEDFGAQKVKQRLEEEFTQIGFQQTLTVDIRNADEVYKNVNEIRIAQESKNTKQVEDKGIQKDVSSQRSQQKGAGNSTIAIPLCLPNSCEWDETSGNIQRDSSQLRRGLQPVNAALRKLRAIQGPVCVVSIAGPCKKGKSYILSRAFDQGNIFPVGHSFEPETMGIWMWVIPEKYMDNNGREFTVVLLDSEGTDAAVESIDNDATFTLCVLLSSVLIYNSAGVATRRDLEELDHIIKNSKRILVMTAGKSLENEDLRNLFPSFVWLLRDVVLALPKGVENMKKFFLERVFKAERGTNSDKSQSGFDSIPKIFSDFDALALPPPSSDPNVILNLTEEVRQGEIDAPFLKGVEDFKEMLRTKLSPKASFGDQGVVTGEGLATLVEGYVKAVNSLVALRLVHTAQREWNVFTKSKCLQTLKNAKAVYDAGIRIYREKEHLPCDERKIRNSHEKSLLEALTFFEMETEGTSLDARLICIEELANYADKAESLLLKDNKSLTNEQCRDLIKALRKRYIDPVFKELQDADSNAEFLVLEERLKSAYRKLDNEFRQQATGSKSVCTNLGNIYMVQHRGEMMEILAQLKGRLNFAQIASETAARKAEVEKKSENIRIASRAEASRKEDLNPFL